MWPKMLGRVYRLGEVVLTPAVRHRLTDGDVAAGLLKHLGKVCGDENHPTHSHPRSPCADGCRLLSASRAADGTSFWVVSESDRSRTTVMLPQEYTWRIPN